MSRHDPKVTVVISVFNKEPYLSQAITSVQAQDHRNLEILVVDDGSTDGSLRLAREHEAKDPRVRVVAHSGVASCRNRGLTESDGQYIVFLDGDDFLYPRYVQSALQYFESHPGTDLLQVSWDYVGQDGSFVSTFTAVDFPDYLERLLLGNIFAIHGVFCDARFLRERVGNFNFYTVTDDWEYWIRCAHAGARFRVLDQTLAATRLHPQNNKKIPEKQKQRFFPIIERVFSADFGLSERYRRLEPASRVRHHFYLLANYVEWGWTEQAREQFERALTLIRSHFIPWKLIEFITPHLSRAQASRLSLAYLRRGSAPAAVRVWSQRLRRHLSPRTKRVFKSIFRRPHHAT